MNISLEFVLYGLAGVAFVGVIYAFKRDAKIQAKKDEQFRLLKAGVPASTSYAASLAEVSDALNQIEDDESFKRKDPYGNHLSMSGEPHGYYGRHRAGPPN